MLPSHSVLILLVDDDPDFRGNLQQLLELESYQTMIAANAAAALGLLQNAQDCPDLMILDVELEGMDGIALAEALYAQPQWKSIDGIIISGSSDARLRQIELLPPNIRVVLIKPCPLNDILETIRRLLEDRKS